MLKGCISNAPPCNFFLKKNSTMKIHFFQKILLWMMHDYISIAVLLLKLWSMHRYYFIGFSI